MSFSDDCMDIDYRLTEWLSPEQRDALERRQQQQQQQQIEPDTALRRAAVRLVGPDRARLTQQRSP